ncbi:MAG: D-glycero-beta-D-manno-heptose 1-phosphate adenylyltransferase [Candidatus Marinimicrobia bacterium]|jgi:D-beta-D-heptose 7-phosphate kinase/D-beta-D-heptose 1-phosphate adenosyltransferase|nr:D-glycero-beta-D-manno-heptose 1-phosphate adenylyltransferase [Candidatus Neomarinimicrobiota bacterium]|tara:strand:+ start:36 stop:509 length:474 start_codon:yes stop_codon:yes gene_type:complete
MDNSKYQLKNVIKAINDDKKDSKKIVFTNGCFDILHVGHIRYLSEAKSLGDILVIGINSDKSVKELKGPSRPINSLSDRALILSELRYVDYVVSFEEQTPLELIKIIMPDILVKGGDYTVETVVGSSEVIHSGGQVKLLQFHEGYSSTNYIDKIKKQ